MRPDDFVDKWASEARAMQQRGALVQGAGLLDEVLRDFEAPQAMNRDFIPHLGAAELPTIWRSNAALFRSYGAGAQADSLEQCAADLECALEAQERAEVDLRGAVRITGYSADHLRRLAAQKKLPVRRQGRRLFFRIGDLGRKPGGFDETRPGRYDPDADARQVIARRSHGGGLP